MMKSPGNTKLRGAGKGRDSESAEKEAKIKELITTLGAHGYEVRREKLKQGPGWKTVSGACRVSTSKILFVDRKLPLDEQLLFLGGALRELNLEQPPLNT